MRLLCLALIALGLVACEPIPLPMATAEADTVGKRFDTPPDGMAALYVYRVHPGDLMTITAGHRTLGAIGGRSWLRVDLSPGTHDVRCVNPPVSSGVGSAQVVLAPGEIKYLSAALSLATFSCRLAEEPAGVARPAILAGGRVREL